MNDSKKGEVWISVVIYIMVVVVVMLIILEAGLPILNKARDKSAFTRIKDTMLSLDQQIVDVANEGQGSQRVIHLDVPAGDVQVADSKLLWKLETGTKVIEPRTRIDQGDLQIASDVDVAATEYPDSYILENSRILVNITRYGSQSNWTNIYTTSLVNYTQFKGTSAKNSGIFRFKLQGVDNSTAGTGYTKISESGTKLTNAYVTAHVNTTNYEYDLKISIDSKADFFRATIENFRAK